MLKRMQSGRCSMPVEFNFFLVRFFFFFYFFILEKHIPCGWFSTVQLLHVQCTLLFHFIIVILHRDCVFFLLKFMKIIIIPIINATMCTRNNRNQKKKRKNERRKKTITKRIESENKNFANRTIDQMKFNTERKRRPTHRIL